MATTVIHVRDMQPGDLYIGRRARRSAHASMLPASPFANPFVIGIHGTRAEVIEQYRAMLADRPDLIALIPELRGKRLACWCAPDPCHGNVLAELADAEDDELRDDPYPGDGPDDDLDGTGDHVVNSAEDDEEDARP